MRGWFGAGMLMGPGDVFAIPCDHPSEANVKAGVVFDYTTQTGIYVGEEVQITVTVSLPTISVEVE